jgi:hypothetical protein
MKMNTQKHFFHRHDALYRMLISIPTN